MKFRESPSHNMLAALECIRSGCRTRRDIQGVLKIGTSHASYLTRALQNLGAIRRIGIDNDGTARYESVPDWEPAKRREVSADGALDSAIELERIWPHPIRLLDGRLREVKRGVWG